MTSLSAPSGGVIGGTVPISLTVSNQGSVGAGAFRVGVYYSVDAVITTSDVFSGWFCNFPSGLSAGSSTGCDGSIAVPASLTPGLYYLGAIADDASTVVESDESNNARAADTGPINLIPVQCDYAISTSGLSVPSSGGKHRSYRSHGCRLPLVDREPPGVVDRFGQHSGNRALDRDVGCRRQFRRSAIGCVVCWRRVRAGPPVGRRRVRRFVLLRCAGSASPGVWRPVDHRAVRHQLRNRSQQFLREFLWRRGHESGVAVHGRIGQLEHVDRHRFAWGDEVLRGREPQCGRPVRLGAGHSGRICSGTSHLPPAHRRRALLRSCRAQQWRLLAVRDALRRDDVRSGRGAVVHGFRGSESQPERHPRTSFARHGTSRACRSPTRYRYRRWARWGITRPSISRCSRVGEPWTVRRTPWCRP